MNDYTAPSTSTIHEEMLDDMPAQYDKGVGGFTYDLTKSIAIESQKSRADIEEVFKKLDVNNLTGDELDRHVYQRKGVVRKAATKSVGEVTAKGNGTVKIGDLFETEAGTQFQVTEEVVITNEGIVKVEAVVEGAGGNVPSNCIVLIPITISGITEVTNSSATYDGFDKETDASLTERYLIEIQKPATSGNAYHYLKWAREVQGVGDARIFPLWNGDNTVKVVIINENNEPASAEIVTTVQDYIDPPGTNNATWGAGYGEAPIGAYCTVESATGLNINVDTTIVLESGYLLAEVTTEVESVISTYLKSIAFIESHVSYAILSSKILGVPGIKEWSSLTVNSGTQNVTIPSDQIAIIGTVTVNE